MAWFKVDDKFPTSKPVMRMPRDRRASAVGLFTLAGAWSADHLTDGYVPRYMIEELASTIADAELLVEVRLWAKTREGYRFREWSPWQPTRAEVEESRKAERDRKAAWRAAKASKPGRAAPRPGIVTEESRGTDPSLTGVSSLTRPDPTRPDPTTTSNEVVKPRKRGTRVPADFVITDEMRAWAKDEAPLVNLDAKLPEWIDYWTGAPNGIKVEWISTWRNGMRKQQEFAERNTAKPTPTQRAQRTVMLATDLPEIEA